MKRFILTAMTVLLIAVSALFAYPSAMAEESVSCNARAALLCNADTGTVVHSKNENERLQIASMVKIMTLNIIFEEIESGNLSYSTDIVASPNATSMGGSQAFLDANCTYKAGELIKSIIVASANDSCVAMAEHISGSVEGFVSVMNERAKEWGMTNTYFVNCTGLPAPNQYSCALDVFKMTKRLIKHKGFFDFSGIWMFDFVHPSGRVTSLSNTNKLVRFYEGCDGGKTGFTSEAKSCLSATAKRGDTRLICVVMGASDAKTRNAEVSKLLNYGFANYETKRFVSANEKCEKPVIVENGKESSVNYETKSDIVLFGKKGEFKDYKLEYEMDSVAAPVHKGDRVGKIKVVGADGTVKGECELVATKTVEEKGYLDIVDDIISEW